MEECQCPAAEKFEVRLEARVKMIKIVLDILVVILPTNSIQRPYMHVLA